MYSVGQFSNFSELSDEVADWWYVLEKHIPLTMTVPPRIVMAHCCFVLLRPCDFSPVD